MRPATISIQALRFSGLLWRIPISVATTAASPIPLYRRSFDIGVVGRMKYASAAAIESST